MWKSMFPEHPLNSSGAGVEAGKHRDDASSFHLCPRDQVDTAQSSSHRKDWLIVRSQAFLSCEERNRSKEKETHSKQLVSDCVRTSFFRPQTLSVRS